MQNIPFGNGEGFVGSFLKGPQEGGCCPAIDHANKNFHSCLEGQNCQLLEKQIKGIVEDFKAHLQHKEFLKSSVQPEEALCFLISSSHNKKFGRGIYEQVGPSSLWVVGYAICEDQQTLFLILLLLLTDILDEIRRTVKEMSMMWYFVI